MGRKQIEWLETCCGSQRSNQYEPLKHLLHDGLPPHRSSLQPFATRLSLFAIGLCRYQLYLANKLYDKYV